MTSRAWGARVALLVLLGSPAGAQEAGVGASGEGITGDADAGGRVFRRCQACHMIGAGAENAVGPVLTGVVGRPAASVEGFDYSPAMREAAAGGLVWTVEELHAFLERPREHVPGTAMAFPGLRSEDQRNDVIAYLQQGSQGGAEGEE